MLRLQHAPSFDPGYGYDLGRLLGVAPPPTPRGFAEFWEGRYRRALAVDPQPRIYPSQARHPRFSVWDLEYRSADGFPIRGWLLRPTFKEARQGFVLGHGYTAVEPAELELPRNDALYLVPCLRGLGLSRHPAIPDRPRDHAIHGILDRDTYVIGGCVEDLWTGVSALLLLAPYLVSHVGYLGTSLGGGAGALALPWERRISRGHLKLPALGHLPLRLSLPTTGNAAAVRSFCRRHPRALETLVWYDAAVAAAFIRQPMHVAAALVDPVVAPPGQFAIYNAIPGLKELFVLTAGHQDYPGRANQAQLLLADLRTFFADL